MDNSTPEKSVSKQPLDTEDFLAFSDSKPTEFSPSISSSPYKAWLNHSRNNSPQYNWNNRRSANNLSYNSPNASQNFDNRSFNSGAEYKQRGSFYKPNRSFNSNFNKSKNNSFKSNSYLHPSFMENPWEKLEKELEELNNQEKED